MALVARRPRAADIRDVGRCLGGHGVDARRREHTRALARIVARMRPHTPLLLLVAACGSSTPVPAAPPSPAPSSSVIVETGLPLLARIALSRTGGCALDNAGIARCWDALHAPRPARCRP